MVTLSFMLMTSYSTSLFSSFPLNLHENGGDVEDGNDVVESGVVSVVMVFVLVTLYWRVLVVVVRVTVYDPADSEETRDFVLSLVIAASAISARSSASSRS